jgi:hypothetical protein
VREEVCGTGQFRVTVNMEALGSSGVYVYVYVFVYREEVWTSLYIKTINFEATRSTCVWLSA